ncbi:hypothetical protein GCO27_08190 [Corynebacterium sp. zg331]|nr:hypothetical protein [Corynebacterium sp. zg331]
MERCFTKLKQWRGIAMRSNKLIRSYRAVVSLTATLIWIQSRLNQHDLAQWRRSVAHQPPASPLTAAPPVRRPPAPEPVPPRRCPSPPPYTTGPPPRSRAPPARPPGRNPHRTTGYAPRRWRPCLPPPVRGAGRSPRR